MPVIDSGRVRGQQRPVVPHPSGQTAAGARQPKGWTTAVFSQPTSEHPAQLALMKGSDMQKDPPVCVQPETGPEPVGGVDGLVAEESET